MSSPVLVAQSSVRRHMVSSDPNFHPGLSRLASHAVFGEAASTPLPASTTLSAAAAILVAAADGALAPVGGPPFLEEGQAFFGDRILARTKRPPDRRRRRDRDVARSE